MSLGPQLKDISPRRLAGAGGTSSWGQSKDIPAGQVIPRTELVRASIGGRPISWSVLIVTTGAVGDTAVVHVESGVGSTLAAQRLTKTVGAPLFFPGWPGSEISVSFEVDVAFVGDGKITAQVAPLHWPAGTWEREGSYSP